MKKRKGVLTPDQQKLIDELAKFSGLLELADGPAITLFDNKALEKFKQAMIKKFGPTIEEKIYQLIDLIFIPLSAIAEAQKQNK